MFRKMKYTDGKYVYYVSGLLGNEQYSVCKRAINSKSLGNHRYRGKNNKVVSTFKEAQEYLDLLALNKKWVVCE
jgi:hypothetical protein